MLLEIEERSPHVPPKGDLHAPIVVVGEAPGADEVRKMEPFVGRSGTLLKKLLHQANIPPYQVYLTNVIKERPKGNVIDPFCNKKGFTPRGQPYVEQLREELSHTSANVIVAAGSVALRALCGIDGILKWRGSILESTLLPGRKVIPTIHPSAALRQFVQRYFILHDLRRAMEQSAFQEIRRPQRKLIINPSFEEAARWLEAFKASGKTEISVDIECGGSIDLSCIAFSHDPSEAICLPIQHLTPREEAMLIRYISEIISDPGITKIGQNFMFDTDFLFKRYDIFPQGRIDDTMIAQNVLFPDFPKGLDFLCSIYTEEPYYKKDGKEWKQVRDWPKFWRYNDLDSATTLEIWYKLKAMLHKDDFLDTYERTVRMHYPLLYPMNRGINADPEGVKRVKQEIEEEITEQQKLLDDEVRSTISNNKVKQVDPGTGQQGLLNVGSPKQMMEYFYMDLGIPPYRSKGKPTCDDKALQRLAKGTSSRPPIQAAKISQKLRSLKKFRSSYLDMEFDDDNRFRCTLNPRGTITGRLSSSQTIFHTGTNMQNIPTQFKGFLRADPGYIMFEIDKVQAEWVATAYISGDAEMIKAVESGEDIHLTTAHFLTGIEKGLLKHEHKLLEHETDPDIIKEIRVGIAKSDPAFELAYRKARFIPRVMSGRQCGKKSNHGFNYGMGASKFALTYETPETDAKMLYDGYHWAYPGLSNWYERIKDALNRNNRILTNPFGRKIRLLDRWGPDLFTQAYAFLPQSTVADIVNEALYSVYCLELAYTDYDILHPAEILGQIHDSVLVQYPISAGPELMAKFLYLMRKEMEPIIEYEGRSFIIKTDAKMGLNWKDMRPINITSVDAAMKDLTAYIEEIKDAEPNPTNNHPA